jgi:transcription elongation factor GreA
MKKQFHLTKEGVEELTQERDQLVAQRGPIAERIKSAREFGDLAENAEYTNAREEQENVEGRIAEIENILLNVEVIKKPANDSKVRLGSGVKLKSAEDGGKTKEFKVVGTVEADPMNGKISDESPIGKALMGRKVGDKVEIVTPADTSTYKVVSIS